MNRPAVKQSMMSVGLLLFAFSWILESGIDAYIFNHGNLVSQILRPDANEIWMRSVVGFCLILFSFYVQIIIRRLREARAELQDANEKLEIRVLERTAELETANRQLANEVEERKHTKEQLCKSEQRYSSLYNSMSEGIALHRIIYDESGRPVDYEILDVNPAFETILGMQRANAIGAKASRLYGTDKAPYLEIYAQVARSGKPVSFETTFESMGKSFGIAAFSPCEGQFAALFADITERKRAEERAGVFAKAFYASPVPATISSLRTERLLMVNDAWLRLIGCDSPQDAIGKSAVELGLWADIEDREERNANLQRAGSSGGQEFRVRTASGQIRNCIHRAEMIDCEGQPHVLSMVIDITERKKTEEAFKILFESTMATTGPEFFDTLAGSLSRWLDVDCVIIGQIDDNETVNVLAMRLDSKPIHDYRHRLSGTPCGIVAKEGYCLYSDGIRNLFPDDKCLAKLGAEGYVGTPLRDSNGRTIGILCGISRSVLDPPPNTEEVMAVIATRASAEIERRQAEGALRDSEQRYRTVVENAGEGIIVAQDARLQFANPYVETVLGRTQEELMSRPFIEFVHPDDRDWVMDIHTRRFRAEEVPEVYEFRAIDKHGAAIWLESNGVLIEWRDRPATLNFLRDITHRKRAIETKLEQQAKFQKYLDIAGVILVALDAQGNVTLLNQKGCEVLGRPATEIIGKNWFDDFVPANSRRSVRAVFDKLMMGELGSSEHVENLIVTKNGIERMVAWHSTVLRDKAGRIVGTLSSGEDITQRRKAEQALIENEKRFRATFEQAAVGVAHVSTAGRFIRINQRFCDIAGYRREEMLGRKFHEITHPDDLEADLAHVRRVLAGEISTYSREKRYFRKNGSVIWVNVTVSLLRQESGEPEFFISVAEDITERKETEKQLQEHQKRLRSLASELSLAEERTRRSAAADLHDNVCQALVLSIMRLQNLRQSADSTNAEILEQVCNTIDHAIQDVRNLTFDLSSPTLYTFGLEAAVSELLDDELHVKHGIDCTFVDDETHKPLDGDVRVLMFQSIRELLINIVKHACARTAKVFIERENDTMKVTVVDDGAGFDVGGAWSLGSRKKGFGLFNIRERLDYVGGNLEIESSPGNGSRFTLRVPLQTEAESPKEQKDGS